MAYEYLEEVTVIVLVAQKNVYVVTFKSVHSNRMVNPLPLSSMDGSLFPLYQPPIQRELMKALIVVIIPQQ